MAWDTLCKHCGVFQRDHDYEHMARECYPNQIEKLESLLEAMEKAGAEQATRADENREVMLRYREAIEWVLRDMSYKAPEQIIGCSIQWFKKLHDAIA